MTAYMYTTNNCSACIKVKEFLLKHSVKIVERDVSDPQHEAFLTNHNFHTVPVTIIDDNIIIGADFRKLAKLVCVYR